MDNPKRTLAKAMTWQISGFFVMALLAYITTGSLAAAGGLAASSAVLGTITYILHERLWARIGWGQQAERTALPNP